MPEPVTIMGVAEGMASSVKGLIYLSADQSALLL